MTIRFYDDADEAMRDATQADFDLMWKHNEEKLKDLVILQDLLAQHGIPLPPGMRRRPLSDLAPYPKLLPERSPS